ncbi:sugar phosphate isomerase/epimerase [Prolixibacteraceae bacterium Z1-6]|uniref:Sugar phosphate isomerase/epimerase n=1 Tax=Draconibacterium aestuarii TaxID=2998507 RepID=A0A9X3F6R1_9BACT|nr:sugar phosphate isomerase/epimerase [Prolixibacteraceae bacterium Z1-6]
MKPTKRRDFMKSMLAVPLMASGLSPLHFNSVSETFSHKFKFSLNVYSFNQLLRDGEIDLFDVLNFCAKYNFDAIDPTGYYFPGYPEVPSANFMREFKRQAFLLGLDISGTGVRNDFANPDKTSRQADIKFIKEWIIAAAKMGIPAIRVFSGTNKHEGFSRDQVFTWMAKDLQDCCMFGREHGVIIAIQNHNDFLKTAADVTRIFEMVDSDWLGLNLDIGSYRQHDPYEEIKKNIKFAVTWQIKENVWIDGKETPTDFVKLFKIIKEAGYRGYLPLETLGAGDPYEKIPVLLEKVQSALQKI